MTDWQRGACTLAGPPTVQIKGGEVMFEVVKKSLLDPFDTVMRFKKGDVVTIGPCVKRGMQDGDTAVTTNLNQPFTQTWTSVKMRNDTNAKKPRNPVFESFEVHGVVRFFVEKWSE
jgi:hypothetical protein